MIDVKDATISGFNEFLESQRQQPGESRWTLYQFSTYGIDALYENASPEDIPLLDDKNYVPNGGTPLWDAVATAIEAAQKVEADDVTIVVQTDGFENASHRPISRVRELIQEGEAAGWQFIFLGANQDAWATSQFLGMNGVSVTYDNHTVSSAFATASSATTSYRSGNAVAAHFDVTTPGSYVAPDEDEDDALREPPGKP